MKNKEKDIKYCGVSKSKIRNAEPILDEEILNTLFYWIKERYTIHIKKDVLEKKGELTNDPILKVYRFTNVRREHDKNTKWLIRNISTNNMITYRDKVMNTILFRLFSKYETMEILGAPLKFSMTWSVKDAVKKLERHIKTDKEYHPFTGSFLTSGMIRTCTRRYPESKTNYEAVLRLVKEINDSSLFTDFETANSQKEIYELLCAFEGISNFTAYQIFVDLTYIDEFPFSENEFTVAGKGCIEGIDRLFEYKSKMNYEECLFWVRDNWENLNNCVRKENKIDLDKLMIDLKPSDRIMNVMSLENCFCELFKYTKVQRKEGRPRKVYKPR